MRLISTPSLLHCLNFDEELENKFISQMKGSQLRIKYIICSRALKRCPIVFAAMRHRE